MRDLQRVGFLGHLDVDTDPLYLKEGNYTDALNVRPLTDSTESSQSIVNILGNEYAVDLGSTVQQNKIYSVAINSVATTLNNQLTFKDQNGNVIATTANFNIAVNANVSVPYAATVLPAILAAFAAATPTLQASVSLSTTGNAFGEVIIELTGAGGFTLTGRNYTVESTGADELIISVVQEGYDTSLAGEMQVIGSYDLLGDLFVWSTSQTELPSTITPTITAITNATPAVVTTSAAHGLVVGQLIKISGVTPTAYNGSWIVAGVPSTTTFSLGGTSALGVYVSGGEIQINTQGIGEVGVIQYDPNLSSANWTYTRLIKSIELNFVTKKQVDTYVEKNSIKKSIYWTDDYNVPRILYYEGDYVEDGALTYYNSEGDYAYDTIDSETKLILGETNTQITFDDQTQGGGQVKSGNWRYAIRLLTESLTGTNYSDLTNPINVFIASTDGDATLISGDDAGEVTPKINNFNITGIVPGLFKYVELAGINYVGDSIVGYTIKREEIVGSSTTLFIQHTGSETVSDLDLGTLNVENIPYATAKNITEIDNRLVLSNLTTDAEANLNDWASNITYSIQRQTIDSVLDTEASDYRVGEYALPVNVYNYMGYMYNETYRVGVKAKYRSTGSWTKTYHVDDITINCTTTARKTSALASYDLTNTNGADASAEDVYVAFLRFTGMDFDALIDGVAFRDLFSHISFERVELNDSNKTILASGMVAMGIYGITGTITLNSGITEVSYNASAPPPNVIGEYPFIAGNDVTSGVVYPGTGAVSAHRKFMAFYSPDILYANTSISKIAGDQLICYGNPDYTQRNNTNPAAQIWANTLFQYNGNTGIATTPTNSATGLYDIDNVKNFEIGETSSLGTETFSKQLYTYRTAGAVYGEATWVNYQSPVINTQQDVTNLSGNNDLGFYMAQYYRPQADQYGDVELSKYIPCGHLLEITSDSNISTTTDVYGGDVFTQKTFFKHRFSNTSSLAGGEPALGFMAGTGFYSQNRVNTQMTKKYDNTDNTWEYPVAALGSWLALDGGGETRSPEYNTGYDCVNNISSDVAFDENNIDVADYPVRIIYSDLKLQSGLMDGYRNFLPLNFKDLDLSYGEIVHMANGNGELITWQPRKFQRQYFNTSGILQTSSNLNVLIGDGSVLSRNGQTLSSIGSKHKWAIIKGKSPQGNDTFYWINTELKKAIRFGYDGTISLADVRGMQSFLANNLTWTDNKDTPADGQGICGVWNNRFMEVNWVVRGKREVTAWSSATAYTTGQTVSYTPSVFSTYEKTGEIYIALRNNTNKNPQTQTSDWAVIPHTNNSYYNEYNLVYNEIRNGFTAFYSFLPKILMQWKDSFLSPQPISPESRIYIHDKGEYCVWYNDDATEQAVDGYIEGVVNAQPDTTKWFEAMLINSEVSPYRFDFTTKTQESFLTASEFFAREGAYMAPIKMDSTGLIVNDSDTSRLYGKYMKARMTFRVRIYQKLVDFIIKFRNSVRLPNR